jgi:hypothetical protein
LQSADGSAVVIDRTTPIAIPRVAMPRIVTSRIVTILVVILIGALTALVGAGPADAQTNAASVQAYYPSCLAAADIVQGKRPAADSEDAAKQLNRAALCFGALTAILNLQTYFKPEYAMCPPNNGQISTTQMVPVVTAYIKDHPDKLHDNFHQVAVAALTAAWPCSK